MRVSTTIHFNGDCEAAFKYYERLGGKLDLLLRWGESPLSAQVPPEWRDKVLHAHLSIGGADLIGGDVRAPDYRQPQGFSMLLAIADGATAERAFALLADGGSVKMPLQKTFWSPLYGVVVDRFGIQWEVNSERSE